MTSHTATAENYILGHLKTEQILDQFKYIPRIADSTLSDLFYKRHSELIKEDGNRSKSSEAINLEFYDEFIQIAEFTRSTTTREQLMGEIRSWALLEADWDGEGAAVPIARCIKNAVSFIRLLPDNISLPEPMLHASGNTGLFWGDGGMYADIEFLHNDRIAYYIEQNGDKHKGAINFDSESLPPVFSVLLRG
ncbi:MAG: hypothetical protein OXE42_06550 [Gammaproteobacteria bacterium]|nr:hypothetical protein [Gammaproteobacteria bacterium]